MAGATNRALKAAGIPKATIQTLRVESGGRLSLRSAIGMAHERKLPVGKAVEHMAKRDARQASSKEGQAAAGDFRAKAAERMKTSAKQTDKENRAAVLVDRLRSRADALGAGSDRGDKAYDRAQKIAQKYPEAGKLADQLRKEKSLEAKAAVVRTMRATMIGGTDRKGAGLPPERSERINNLLARSKAQFEKSAARVKAARLARENAAKKPQPAPNSALDRYRADVKARMKADERESLTKMVGSVQRNARVGREALANSPKPRGGLERSVEHGILGGKTSVRNVKPIAKSGDFFVHKTGGLSSGYGVTHRPTGTMVYSSHSRSAAHAAMDGVAKTGGKVMSRIEGGDLRAAKALKKYMGRLGTASFYNAAHAKYGKRAD
jgi:hypothetical protein